MTDASEQNQSQSSEKPQTEQVCSFFKKPTKNNNIRKQVIEQDEYAEDTEGTSVLSPMKKTSKADNKLYFSSGQSKKCVASTDSVDESNNAMFQYESSKVIEVQSDHKATTTLETKAVFSRDARAIRERALKQAKEALKGKNKVSGDDKLYKGMSGYTDFKAGIRRKQTIASEKADGAHGLLRASTHIRVSARFDYQHDICKDYKEIGYCVYGDSCKFMHDRGDYKPGGQLEKESEEAEKARKRNLAMEGGDDDDEDSAVQSKDDDDDGSLPFARFICRQPFVDAVVTKCKHYFCEHCALMHHMKNKKCFVCNQPTLGMFNTTHEIRKRMAEDKKK